MKATRRFTGYIVDPSKNLLDYVYAGFVHTVPKPGGGRGWPTDEVFEMFVRD